jgi:hypothetical protein
MLYTTQWLPLDVWEVRHQQATTAKAWPGEGGAPALAGRECSAPDCRAPGTMEAKPGTGQLEGDAGTRVDEVWNRLLAAFPSSLASYLRYAAPGLTLGRDASSNPSGRSLPTARPVPVELAGWF